MKRIQYLCVFLVLSCSSAWAQSSDSWDWKVTPYLWTVGISGDLAIGDIEQELEVSFKDILSDFELGGSIYAEIGKGNHAVHFDYTYLRLRPDPTALPTPPYPQNSTLATKMTTNIFEPAYHYRFDGLDSTEFVLGARYWDIEMRMTPDVAGPSLPVDPPFPSDPVEAGPSWWDYFIGVKTNNQISNNWDFGFYGTLGAGASDLPWTLQAMFSRQFSNENRLALGLRVWNIDYSKNKGPKDEFIGIDAIFYGLMIGYEFN